MIRNLIPSDLTDFHAYRSNPDVTKYQGFDVMTLEECEAFIEAQKEKLFRKPGEWVQYAIADRSSDQLLGDCAIKLQEMDSRISEVGITISPGRQNKGYAKEALIGIMSFLFEKQGIHRVQEIVDEDNLESIRLLESIGFRKEGILLIIYFLKENGGASFNMPCLSVNGRSKEQNFLLMSTFNGRFISRQIYENGLTKGSCEMLVDFMQIKICGF